MQPHSFWLVKLINIFLSIVQIVIGLYIVLKMFGAAEVPFVRFIYGLSAPLLSPFAGIFNPVKFMDNYQLDLSAIFALIIYSAIGFILMRLALLIERK
ncbi:MAG: YggT family protein [Tuberibacillus sp.]